MSGLIEIGADTRRSSNWVKANQLKYSRFSPPDSYSRDVRIGGRPPEMNKAEVT